MKRLSEWPYGTSEKKLLEKCRNIVTGIEPEAEVFLCHFKRSHLRKEFLSKPVGAGHAAF